MGSDTINLRHMTLAITEEQQLAVCCFFAASGFAWDHRTVAKSRYCMDDLMWGIEHSDMLEVFLAFDFHASTPRNSSTITSVSYTGDFDDALWLWKNIAQALPELDGFIEWAGEGGTRFRWIFKDGTVTEIAPRLLWENDA